MRRILILCGICLCHFLSAEAQGKISIAPSVINAAGSNYSQGYYNIDWSIGELALVNQMTNTGHQLIVTNGFIQPYTQEPNKRDNFYRFTDEEVIILPNPTMGMLEINFRTHQMGHVRFIMYDENGQQVYSKEFISYGYGRIERVNMGRFANGPYYLYILLSPDPGYSPKKGVYKILKVH